MLSLDNMIKQDIGEYKVISFNKCDEKMPTGNGEYDLAPIWEVIYGNIDDQSITLRVCVMLYGERSHLVYGNDYVGFNPSEFSDLHIITTDDEV